MSVPWTSSIPCIPWAPRGAAQSLRLPRPLLAVVLVIGLVAGAAATVWLWWHDTPADMLDGLGAELTAAGRVTGLLGGYLLLVEVTLMSRIPQLERRIGSDWLAAAHRALGGYLVCMLVAHSVLIVAGYAVTAHKGLATETASVVLDEPDVLMATAGLALLVGVGWLSARRVRRRLAYETWYYLHLYAYLAVLLAFAHQLAVGAEFTDNRLARVAWTGMHVAVALCLFTFRVGAPLRLALWHRLRVAAVRREAPGALSRQQVLGPVVQTQYGPVQVRVTLQGGRIVDVAATQLPSEAARSVEISSHAAPILHDEVLQAQSAQIDAVSGATYTSRGYVQSLQAALDSARAGGP